MSERTYGGYTAGDLREMRDAAEGGIDYELYNGEMLHDYHPDEARFYTAAYTAIPALLDEVARIAELEAALSKLHSATLQMAVRLGDAGLYGTPDDLPGGKNQIALETARALMEDRR